ncbi:PITH domain protein [Kalmanozyma brasiliensis GHG001]|uniref:PITH domain-containing protein n=1 Tax=Kalmanozyma brasiliensis (strain GHG001) TaxID=1365824 RepID=V5E511_KALBG|nr:PITH domain protein [Kalmanozyma brasiliensis GHG001]EST05301.1 PITH domain protein [Kalmanozyma brasiliensis GHG001]
MSHPHSHSGPCGHSHHDDDSHVAPDAGDQDLLFTSIDRDRVLTLNESTPGSGAAIIKTWDRRLDAEPSCISDADDQLILHIPFTSSVKLTTLLFRPSSEADLTPSCIKLYKNLPESALNFDDISSLPPAKVTTTLESIPTITDTKDVISFPLQPVKWANTDSITLFIESSIGRDQTGLAFLGFKGKSSGYTRGAPQNIVYESAPQLKDHSKVGTDSLASTHGFGH